MQGNRTVRSKPGSGIPIMLGSDFVKSQLAVRAWQDGRDEGLNGMLSVAFCIRNRVRAGFYNGDWIQVLSHHQDYAAVDKVYSLELPDPRSYAFSLLLQEIDGIFSGTREDTVTQPDNKTWMVKAEHQGERPVALYYARLDDQNIKEWFYENITRNTEHHRLIATVGALSFFS